MCSPALAARGGIERIIRGDERMRKRGREGKKKKRKERRRGNIGSRARSFSPASSLLGQKNQGKKKKRAQGIARGLLLSRTVSCSASGRAGGEIKGKKYVGKKKKKKKKKKKRGGGQKPEGRSGRPPSLPVG